MNTPSIEDLKPGDNLLFARRGVMNWIIAVKTWCKTATHSEVYIGDGKVAACRSGGVNTYDLDLRGISYVRRPNTPVDINKAMAWHNRCIGQKYDWIGLFSFWLAVKNPSLKKQWCSEHDTRFWRAGGFEPLNPDWDADMVAPATLLSSSAFTTVWSANERAQEKREWEAANL